MNPKCLQCDEFCQFNGFCPGMACDWDLKECFVPIPTEADAQPRVSMLGLIAACIVLGIALGLWACLI
jgi:hypothetical protein